MTTMTPVSKDDPLRINWERYKQSEEYANTRRWALKEEGVEGSLWAAFMTGWLMRDALAARAEAERSVLNDHDRLVRELDIALNGEGAAKQASLCDIVAQIKAEKECAGVPEDVRELAMEGLDYFERVGDASERTYVKAIRQFIPDTPEPPKVTP